jgi:hypothetical protein
VTRRRYTKHATSQRIRVIIASAQVLHLRSACSGLFGQLVYSEPISDSGHLITTELVQNCDPFSTACHHKYYMISILMTPTNEILPVYSPNTGVGVTHTCASSLPACRRVQAVISTVDMQQYYRSAFCVIALNRGAMCNTHAQLVILASPNHVAHQSLTISSRMRMTLDGLLYVLTRRVEWSPAIQHFESELRACRKTCSRWVTHQGHYLGACFPSSAFSIACIPAFSTASEPTCRGYLRDSLTVSNLILVRRTLGLNQIAPLKNRAQNGPQKSSSTSATNIQLWKRILPGGNHHRDRAVLGTQLLLQFLHSSLNF